MIKYISIHFIILATVLKLPAQKYDSICISASFNNTSFYEFIHSVKQTAPQINFYYKNEWIDTFFINLEFDSTRLDIALNKIFQNTDLSYFYLKPDKIILLPNKTTINTIPKFTLNAPVKVKIKDSSVIVSLEKKYLKGREPDMIETIVVGEKESAGKGKSAIITGKLFEEGTGDPLYGATLYIKELQKGAVTDSYGNMSLALKIGKYYADFQCLGMANVKCILDVRSNGYFSLAMNKEITSLAEVTINANQTNKRGSKIGLEKISIKSIKELPTLMGEKDVLKISQMLPGIVSVSEASGGVNVRGGNADQNLFYINDAPIYNTTHLFGFFSAINSNIITDFTIHKGLVPAKYGGRLSSIFNIETRSGKKNRFFTQGGISPISANIEIETPIIKDKCSMMVSARSSYSDWILKRMEDPKLRNSNVLFYDLATAIDYKISENTNIKAFAYFSKDKFSLNKLTDYEYSNISSSINLQHNFSQSSSANVILTGTNYSFNTIDKNNLSNAYSHEFTIEHYELKSNFTFILNEFHTLSTGGNIILYKLVRGNVNPWGEESLREVVLLGNELGIESAIFLDEKFSVNNWLNLYGGIRFSNFNEYGSKDILKYKENAPKNENYIIDTIHSANGEKIVNYNGPEFRFAANFKLNNFNSFKLSYNQMRQYLFMLSNTFSISPTDQWKLADYHIAPPKSHQFTAGYYLNIPALSSSFSSELYYKFSDNIVEYKDGADFISTPHIESLVLQGSQNAYGLELMINKEKGKFNGWISYTYSRSLISIDGSNEWDKINNGKTYPSNFDKPHVCNVIANYKINRRFSVSSNLVYSTGRPITLPEGAYYMQNKPYYNYSARNEYRIPDYFRLDMSITMEGNLKSKKLFHSFWMFSVYNLTGRKNPYTISFKSEDGYLKGYKYSVIGVPLFTVSWNFKLGNYTND